MLELCNSSGDRLHDIVPLRHPRTGTKGQFSFNGDNELLELQRVDGEENSYFVDDTVVSDGTLWMLSPVDPNFHLLYYLDQARAKTEEHAGRFGVIEDALNDAVFPATKLLATAKNVRLEKICDIKDKGEIYVRLNDEKVLSWLEAKARPPEPHQQSLTPDPPTHPASECFFRAAQVEAIAAKLASTYKEEAVVSTFKRDEPVGGEGEASAPTMEVKPAVAATPPVGSSEREFAVGLLSEYLSSHWTGLLAKHVGVRTPDECTKENSTPSNYVCPDNYQPEAPTAEDLSKKRKAEAALTTRGQQQLKKINTKGMKSMMSFFGAKPKKA